MLNNCEFFSNEPKMDTIDGLVYERIQHYLSHDEEQFLALTCKQFYNWFFDIKLSNLNASFHKNLKQMCSLIQCDQFKSSFYRTLETHYGQLRIDEKVLINEKFISALYSKTFYRYIFVPLAEITKKFQVSLTSLIMFQSKMKLSTLLKMSMNPKDYQELKDDCTKKAQQIFGSDIATNRFNFLFYRKDWHLISKLCANIKNMSPDHKELISVVIYFLKEFNLEDSLNKKHFFFHMNQISTRDSEEFIEFCKLHHLFEDFTIVSQFTYEVIKAIIIYYSNKFHSQDFDSKIRKIILLFNEKTELFLFELEMNLDIYDTVFALSYEEICSKVDCLLSFELYSPHLISLLLTIPISELKKRAKFVQKFEYHQVQDSNVVFAFSSQQLKAMWYYFLNTQQLLNFLKWIRGTENCVYCSFLSPKQFGHLLRMSTLSTKIKPRLDVMTRIILFGSSCEEFFQKDIITQQLFSKNCGTYDEWQDLWNLENSLNSNFILNLFSKTKKQRPLEFKLFLLTVKRLSHLSTLEIQTRREGIMLHFVALIEEFLSNFCDYFIVLESMTSFFTEKMYIFTILEPKELIENFVAFKVNFFNFVQTSFQNKRLYFDFCPAFFIVLNNVQQLTLFNKLNQHQYFSDWHKIAIDFILSAWHI